MLLEIFGSLLKLAEYVPGSAPAFIEPIDIDVSLPPPPSIIDPFAISLAGIPDKSSVVISGI